MAIQKCPSLSKIPVPSNPPAGVNVSLQEPIVGTPAFPLAIYDDDVEKDTIVWHWHEEFEIGCITEGTILTEIGSRKYTLHSGDIFFVNSEVLHSMRNAAPGNPASLKDFVFHASIIGGRENSIFHQKYVLPVLKNAWLKDFIFKQEDPHTGRLFSELSHLWTVLSNEEPGYELSARNTLSAFFQCMLARTDTRTLPVPDNEQRLEERAKKMLDYIHCHFSETITLEEIADSAAVSVSEALRCFKAILGTSPIQYLKKYRLLQAAAYLKSGSYSIREICELCGFSDSSYFSKSFRQVYHCAPKDYAESFSMILS